MAKHTKVEMERINRQLATVGERICTLCYQRKPLTTDYWYQTTPTTGRCAGKTVWIARCKVCHSSKASEASRRRYRRPGVKARKTETARVWRTSNRENCNAAAKRYRRNKLKRKLDRVMGKGEAA